MAPYELPHRANSTSPNVVMMRRTVHASCIITKAGAPKIKNGGTCGWSHKIPFTNAETNAMSVIAVKRKKEEDKILEDQAKNGKAGRKGGKSRSNSRGRKGGGKDSRTSDQPCRSWEQHGTCVYGDSCRYVHVAK